MIVVGAGLVGLATAWLLQHRGHTVLLVEPPSASLWRPAQPCHDESARLRSVPSGSSGCISVRSGSAAALGLLMAQVFQRGSGRGWRLRQRSLRLWQQWRQELAQRGQTIHWRPGLLLLAATAEERSRHQRLVCERREQGLPLELWDTSRLSRLEPAPPLGALAALHSPEDGQLDPVQALEALRADGLAAGLRCLVSRVRALRETHGCGGRWGVLLEDGRELETDWLVLAAGLASAELLRPLGLERPLEPVLGQALELELAEPASWRDWPGVVSWKGLHLVPRPDRAEGRRLWLGATVEPGSDPSAAALAQLRELAGDAPKWLVRAELRQHWLGVRARPRDRPAPVLEQPRPGLLLACGHNRNGVLLAPISAEWALSQVEERDDPPGWTPAS
ncbi:MAG: FAD-dependent oxidoreductase [Synechococcaceae cyanobacterium]|nr:FAD-dependent oxidoreductase [Synechococcaceae cyanobacterium]